jgi:hypothetical protein
MPDQDGRRVVALELGDQLVDQRMPVVVHREAGIVAEHVGGTHVEVAAQLPEQASVGAGRVAVPVREMQQRLVHGAHCKGYRSPPILV